MRYRPIYSERKAVSPVIAVILLVGITVVLVATLYFTVNSLIEEAQVTPRVGIYFNEDQVIQGYYVGHIAMTTEKIYIVDVSVTIIDYETSAIGVITPLSHGASVQVGPQDSGMNLTYYDFGLEGRLDGGDRFELYNGTRGDTINLLYLPTSSSMGSAELLS